MRAGTKYLITLEMESPFPTTGDVESGNIVTGETAPGTKYA
jgi:hypothetical protein